MKYYLISDSKSIQEDIEFLKNHYKQSYTEDAHVINLVLKRKIGSFGNDK